MFLTVCTKDRNPWLATDKCHNILREIWKSATSWFVGKYVLMPDHLHLFATPGDPELPLENWIRYWKSQFSKRAKQPELRWQTSYWDTRLRMEDRYEEKWNYVVANPERKGLVATWDQWPYLGEIFEIRWN